jgi:hypothetical protein
MSAWFDRHTETIQQRTECRGRNRQKGIERRARDEEERCADGVVTPTLFFFFVFFLDNR